MRPLGESFIGNQHKGSTFALFFAVLILSHIKNKGISYTVSLTALSCVQVQSSSNLALLIRHKSAVATVKRPHFVAQNGETI